MWTRGKALFREEIFLNSEHKHMIIKLNLNWCKKVLEINWM